MREAILNKHKISRSDGGQRREAEAEVEAELTRDVREG